MVSMTLLGKRAGLLLVIAFLLGFTMSGMILAADKGCKHVEGKLSVHVTNPLPQLQTQGTIIGVLSGTYDFALVEATASLTPGVSFFDASSNIHTRNGDLVMKEAGTFGFSTPTSTTANIAVIWTVEGGSGAWTKAAGEIFAFGTVDLVAGSGEFLYRGDLCSR